VRVDFGRCAIVRFRLAALAAFLIFRRAAAFCLLLAIASSSVMLEILNGAFVSQSLVFRREGAQVAAFACLGILFARVQAVLSCFEFANHEQWDARLSYVVFCLRSSACMVPTALVRVPLSDVQNVWTWPANQSPAVAAGRAQGLALCS
jgi:hypothetical protein